MPGRLSAAPTAAVAAALGLASAAVYWLTRQDWLFGDGSGLVRLLVRGHEQGVLPVWRHVLYLPLCSAVMTALPSLEAADAARLVSAAAGGVLVAACYAICKRFAGTLPALIATLLAASSQAVWFFSTTVELHALHGAVAALGALAVIAARGRLRDVAAAGCTALCFLAHESSWLLVPGWVLLAAGYGVEPSAPSLRAVPIARWLRASSAVLAGAALGVLAASAIKAIGTGAGNLNALELVGVMHRGLDLRLLWSGVLGPHIALFTLSLLRPARRWPLLLAFVVPHAAFVVGVFGDPNGGGYLLPVVWVLALFAAGSLESSRSARWLAAPLFALQLLWIHNLATLPGQELAREARERRARAAELALPHGGVLLSVDFSLQTAEGIAAGVREINLYGEVVRAAKQREDPGAFASRLLPHLEAVRASEPLAFDLSFEEQLKPYPEAGALMDALIAEATRRLSGAVLEHGGVRILVFE